MAQSVVHVVILVAAVIVLKADCQERSRNGITTETYDVGCYTHRDRLATGNIFLSLFQHFDVPTCMDGGVYKIVQCTTFLCSCAYVDTGKIFGNWTCEIQYQDEMARQCPVRTEKYTPSCKKPPITYPCNLSKQKYAYNAEKRRCEASSFGCFGYETKEDCQRICETARKQTRPTLNNKCSFPLNIGRRCSKKREKRYRHNSATGKCEEFMYEGCFGNANNFKSRWECQRDCVPQGNITTSIQVDFEQQYLVVLSDWLATRFRLNSERMNDVSTETFSEIRRHASSMLSMQKPPRSTAIVPKPISHPESDLLDEEIEHHKKSPEEICHLPPSTGSCRGYFSRWYYSQEESKCKRFTYGGCHANDNNFTSLRKCMGYCKSARRTPTEENVLVP